MSAPTPDARHSTRDALRLAAALAREALHPDGRWLRDVRRAVLLALRREERDARRARKALPVAASRRHVAIDFSDKAARDFLSAVTVGMMTDSLHGRTGAVLASIAARLNGDREGPIVIERFKT